MGGEVTFTRPCIVISLGILNTKQTEGHENDYTYAAFLLSAPGTGTPPEVSTNSTGARIFIISKTSASADAVATGWYLVGRGKSPGSSTTGEKAETKRPASA